MRSSPGMGGPRAGRLQLGGLHVRPGGDWCAVLEFAFHFLLCVAQAARQAERGGERREASGAERDKGGSVPRCVSPCGGASPRRRPACPRPSCAAPGNPGCHSPGCSWPGLRSILAGFKKSLPPQSLGDAATAELWVGKQVFPLEALPSGSLLPLP